MRSLSSTLPVSLRVLLVSHGSSVPGVPTGLRWAVNAVAVAVRTWAPVFEKVTCDQSVPRANAVFAPPPARLPLHRATVLVPPSPTAEEQRTAGSACSADREARSSKRSSGRPNPRRSRCQISQMINQNQQIRDLLLYSASVSEVRPGTPLLRSTFFRSHYGFISGPQLRMAPMVALAASVS